MVGRLLLQYKLLVIEIVIAAGPLLGRRYNSLATNFGQYAGDRRFSVKPLTARTEESGSVRVSSPNMTLLSRNFTRVEMLSIRLSKPKLFRSLAQLSDPLPYVVKPGKALTDRRTMSGRPTG